jgi:tetratricopeptide (TPR) repeat protein
MMDKGQDIMIIPMDYYAILGIPRSASESEVREAYKREVRIWRKRAAVSSQDSVRDEAVRRLVLLAEAFNTLSDAQRRTAYNRQPTSALAAPISNSLVHPQMLNSNLIEQAESYLAVADYQAAARAAREATSNMGNSAESWFVLSRANAGLRQLNDAVYEARRAIELAPENPRYQFNLGTIYEELGRWDEALSSYGRSAQLEPTEPLYQLAIGAVWLQNAQPAKAMAIFESIYSAFPDGEVPCYYYAQGLISMAEAIPKDQAKEGYAVTSAREIQEMRGYLSRATGIKHLDQETKQAIQNIEVYLRRMEKHTYHAPLGARSFMFEMINTSDGCAPALISISLVMAIFGAPVLVFMWGYSLLTSGSILYGLLLLLCSIGLGYLWFRSVWVPRWKVNARMRDHRIRYLS